MSSWKLVAEVSRRNAEAALEAQGGREDWDHDIVLTAQEAAPHRPEDWLVEAYLPRRPGKADRAAIAGLFANPPELSAEELPETDWVTQSQQAVQPIRAGRFHVRTPDHAASDEPGAVDFVIPASQAFGTGQHETTAGCLAMLDAMKRRGVIARNLVDIGTGTGLLAFAALALWPRAHAVASDIDPVCAGVVLDNMHANQIPLGTRAGELAFLVAGGMDDPALQARAPYDLLIANILAGPLIDLAPDFAEAVAPGGSLLLAGLLETQEPAVRAAYRRVRFRLAARLVRGDWSILWLRQRG